MTNTSKVRKYLKSFVGTMKQVRITRPYPGNPTHFGFVLGVGKELVLLQQLHDFYPDGYSVLRLEDVVTIRSGEQERFFETLLQKEGLMELVGITEIPPLDDLRSLFEYLQERNQNVVVEVEGDDTDEDDEFLIGRVVAVESEGVELLYFDPLGQWDAEPIAIDFEEITQVQFDTPYVNILSKYLGEPPTPKL